MENGIDLNYGHLLMGLDELDIAITIFDRDLNLSFFNDKVSEVLGFPKTFLERGMNLRKLFEYNARRGDYGVGDLSDLVTERLELANKFVPHEFTRTTQDGTVLKICGKPVDSIGFITTYTDITAQIAAEKKLHWERQKANDFASITSDWFWETDKQGRFTYLSDSFEEITGLVRSEFINKTRNEITNSGIKKHIGFSQMEQAEKNREPFNDFTYQLENKSKQLLQISISGIPYFDESGNYQGYRGIGKDKTQADKIQNQLRKLGKIATQSPLSIIITNHSGDIEFVNPAFEKITGYSFIDVVGRNPSFLKSGYTTQAQYKELWDTITAGKIWHGTFRNIAKNGDHYWMRTTIAPIRNDLGEITNFVNFGEDIHEQLEVESALERERKTNQLQREFVSLVSHEFRTPLAVIDSNAQRILRHMDNVSKENLAERMDTMRDMVKRMTSLIESTLSLSRLDEGELNYNPELGSLKDLIINTLSRFEKIEDDRNYICNIDDMPDLLNFDPTLMDQVLNNLVSNAQKYSENDSEISLIGGQNGAYVYLSVINTGIGIPKEEIPKLFRRFFRASTSEGIPGTGIGLHLIKNIVKMHGGKISVESEPNKETTFTIIIPKNTSDKSTGDRNNGDNTLY